MASISLDGLDNEIRSSLETIGQQVEIERFANKGANGYVFFGRNKILNRKVAIKYYYWGSDPRLHDEPRLLSQIESPYVIPVLNAGPVGSNWAMFQTPYCEYGDLDGMIEARTLSTHAAIDRITEVLTGLSALHTSGLVHRDIKPGNILIGDTGCAMIGDFGSVKAVSEKGRVNSASGQSALYRPPESFSHREYTKVSDIYQCGLVFFQLLGGHLPSKERELLDTAGRYRMKQAKDGFERSLCLDEAIGRLARNGRLANLSTLPISVSRQLRRIIRKATNPPDKRYPNCSSFINAVRKAKASSLNWHCNGGNTIVSQTADGRLRITRIDQDGRFRAERNTGNGWRKARGISEGPIADVLEAVEERYRTRLDGVERFPDRC